MEVENKEEIKRKKVKKKKSSSGTNSKSGNKRTKSKSSSSSAKDSRNKTKTKKSSSSKKSKKGSNKGKKHVNNQTLEQVQVAQAVPRSTKSKLIGTIGNLIFYVTLIAVIAGAGLVYFGYKIMTVLTESMKPNKKTEYKNGFEKGSLIFVKSQDPYELKKGDIITFNPVRGNKSVYLTHRVVGIDKEKKEKRQAFITTKGDANTGNDVPIGASQVQGKVVKSIPNAGFILSFLKKHIVVVAILLSTLFGIIVTLKYLRVAY
ncbi:signal peptidase I [Vagococcus carniphilus]|uniref:signal peptidase I n=1 Tax=Vagococcus carniphilus TaxID=218144 RepID=UPI003B5A567F